jgi:hypothetical protein
MEHSILILSLFVPSFLASDLQLVRCRMQHLLLASLNLLISRSLKIYILFLQENIYYFTLAKDYDN